LFLKELHFHSSELLTWKHLLSTCQTPGTNTAYVRVRNVASPKWHCLFQTCLL